ncbi:MAG TPA: NTP transferase domain-containing protein [Verrucomicrobiota bacterium]|nr:NTP transferase domain-containing protein [Verrucomicrobiota bacterium]
MPRSIAFIPVRGGSRSIPGKNIRPLAGKPLVHWVLAAAAGCPAIDRVYVATDDDAIRAVVRDFGSDRVEVVGRSAATATDTASTESAMLEFARSRDDFDRLVLIQATSPLLTSDDLARGLRLLAEAGADSLVSVVEQKRFLWRPAADGLAAPQNYDPLRRPRRQEFAGYWVENGAFYVSSRAGLLASGCRLHGRIVACPMPEETYFELDEPADWTIVAGLLASRSDSRSGEFHEPVPELTLTRSGEPSPRPPRSGELREPAPRSSLSGELPRAAAPGSRELAPPTGTAGGTDRFGAASYHEPGRGSQELAPPGSALADLGPGPVPRRPVRLLLTDVDGVLTDAGMYYDDGDNELKKFNTRDGKGFELLRARGIRAGIVTSEDTRIVARRAAKLKLEFLFQGVKEKLPVVQELLAREGLHPSEVAYIGDDVNDLEVLRHVGWAACPADAEPAVRAVARLHCSRRGGEGAVRELADYLLAQIPPALGGAGSLEPPLLGGASSTSPAPEGRIPTSPGAEKDDGLTKGSCNSPLRDPSH